MSDYKIFDEKEKKKVFEIVKRELSRFGVRNFLIYGSFIRRNYSRDLDIAIFDKISENKLNKIASSLERKIGIEVDIRRFDELPEPIKYLVLTQGKGRIEEKFRKETFDFLRAYIDFVEWLRKWS
jgi:predicted nucleotidyltransferase